MLPFDAFHEGGFEGALGVVIPGLLFRKLPILQGDSTGEQAGLRCPPSKETELAFDLNEERRYRLCCWCYNAPIHVCGVRQAVQARFLWGRCKKWRKQN